MDLGLSGKVAIIAGASKGLGRGTALALSREGASVVICARGERALHETEVGLPGDALAVPADFTEPGTPGSLVEAALERFGSVDIVVGNAAGPPPASALEATDEELMNAFNDNALSSIRLARAAAPHMRRTGWGRIVFIGSSFVKQPSPRLVLSNTARTALWAWTKTAAQDLISEGVTVNMVLPGTHDTDRTRELGTVADRMGDPEDFGRVVAFLCSSSAGYISGVALQVDGAATLGLL